MAELDQLLRTQNARVSFVDYATATFGQPLHPWQRDHLCPILQRFAIGKGLRIRIHAPPQVGKSLLVSERLPAYILGVNPTAKVFLASYNIDKATEFGEVVRQLLSGEEHHALFADALSWVAPDVAAKKFKTPARMRLRESQPSFQALGLLSGFTGKGPTHLIIDDPYKSAEDAESPVINDKTVRWVVKTAYGRISEECNVLLMYHRYHPEDLAARVEHLWDWDDYRFPIIADDNEDGKDPTGREEGEPLSPLRPVSWCLQWQASDPETFAGQGQGKPVVEGDALINPDWFREIDWEDAPELRFYHRCYDLALKDKKKNDETATGIAGFDEDLNFYIYDMDHWKRDTPRSMEEVEEYALSDPKGTFIVFYDEVVQLAVVQQLTYQDHLSVEEIEGHGQNKWARAAAWARRAKQGRIFLVRPPKPETEIRNTYKPVPKDRSGKWIPWFKNQCLYFRNLDTNKDDGIDAISGCYNHGYKHAGQTRKESKGPPIGSAAYYRELAKRGE